MTNNPRQYHRRSREEWQSLIAQWQQSDLSAITFCKHHGLSAASFYKWRQRFIDNLDNIDNQDEQVPRKVLTTSPDFIDITSLNASAGNSAWHIVLDLGNGLSLTLNRR